SRHEGAIAVVANFCSAFSPASVGFETFRSRTGMLKAFLRLQSLHCRFYTARTTGLLKPIYIFTSIRFLVARWRFTISTGATRTHLLSLYPALVGKQAKVRRTRIATCA